MANYRMLPPASGPLQTCVVNGRTYVGVAGTPQDIIEGDRVGLQANGWTLLGEVGATSGRPAQPHIPAKIFYIDTTVGKPCWHDGATWRDYLGNSV